MKLSNHTITTYQETNHWCLLPATFAKTLNVFSICILLRYLHFSICGVNSSQGFSYTWNSFFSVKPAILENLFVPNNFCCSNFPFDTWSRNLIHSFYPILEARLKNGKQNVQNKCIMPQKALQKNSDNNDTSHTTRHQNRLTMKVSSSKQ